MYISKISLIKLLLGAFSIVPSSIADSKGGCLNRQALINVCELIAANIKQVSFQPYSLINNSLTGDRTNKPKPEPETAIPIIFSFYKYLILLNFNKNVFTSG